MKKIVLPLSAAFLFLLAAAGILPAAEDHTSYRSMTLPECNSCHEDSDVPPNHVVGWNVEHALLAQKEVKNCSTCHRQDFCNECHQGGGVDAKLHVANTRGTDYVPRSHRGGFIETHPFAALDAPRSCEKCHAERFCQDCHARFRPEELMFSSHRKGWSDLKTSPVGPAHSTFTEGMCQTCHPNSVLPAHEWSREHAREARRDLAACQSCHGEGDVCLKCHSAKSGLLVNPHPDNWNGIKSNLEKASGRRTCVRCH